MCIRNDGNDWEKDRGGQHLTSFANKDATIITINCGYYLRLQVFLPKCEVFFSNCVGAPKKKRGEGKFVEMGGDLMCSDSDMIEENVNKLLVWYLLKKGGFVSFMEVLNGHDENFSMQFFNSWEDHRVTINGISFHISKEVITLVTGLARKGRKW